MVLLISELAKIGAIKSIFLYSGSLGGRGLCMGGHALLSLYSSNTKFKGKTLFSLSLTAICAAMLPNYLRTYSSALQLCQIRALEKAFKFKKQNNGQSVPKILVLNACI